MCRSDGKRPDGVTLFPWRRGKCLVWDATCTDPLSITNRNISALAGGQAAAAAENKKKEKTSWSSISSGR